MLIQVLLSYLAYALVTAFTPGPNNIIALYAISQNGWKKGKYTLLGIGAGFLSVMLLCAGLCYELARFIPSITGVMKYVGAAYILWLAIHVARSKPEEGGGSQVSFWKGFALQFANVKIILSAITTFSGYVLPVTSSASALIIHAIFLTLIGVSGTFTWAIAGGLLQKFLSKHYRVFNALMALVLVICAVKLFL